MKQLQRNADQIMLVLGAIFFAISIWLFWKFAFDPAFFTPDTKLNPVLADQYGSFIGGLIGTIMGFATTLFLVYTILFQLKTSRQNQIESAFYKLVDYHKDNVEKMAIYGSEFCARGNEAFVVLQKKFDMIFNLVKTHSQISDEKILIDISYTLLFFGFQDDSKEFLKTKIATSLSPMSFEDFYTKISHNTPTLGYKRNSLSLRDSNEHQLGHYFRNLFNTYGIIDCDSLLSKNEKEFYLKILRTQFSTPAVWMILINSLSHLGRAWNDKKYIEKYSVIKNIPEDYSKTINFLSYYPNIPYEFRE